MKHFPGPHKEQDETLNDRKDETATNNGEALT